METVTKTALEPPRKKLKQSRLSFQVIGPKIKLAEVTTKKRKLSDTSLTDDEKIVKQVRSEEHCSDVVLISDDEVDLGPRAVDQPDISTFFTVKNKETDQKQADISLPDVKTVNEHEQSNVAPENLDQGNITLEHDSTLKDNLDDSTVKDTTDSESPETPKTKLTPKQLNKKIGSAKKQEERERQRLEKLKKQQEEKEEKIKQKQEREEQKRKEREEKEEQKRKEREEKEEQRRKEREEKEEQRRKEREEKEEQRRKEREEREEERRKKEEQKETERRKKEQERLETELKQKKTAEAFVKFFVANKEEKRLNSSMDVNFMPFAIKSDMRMAPVSRCILTSERKSNMERDIADQNEKSILYLEELKNGKTIGRGFRTWQMEPDDDVICLDEADDNACTGDVVELPPAPPEKMRVKLFQFKENRRPPYWGTWRKKSNLIRPRRPFGTDSKIFDYEIDSDDEWEEEEPGESLHGSDDEKEKESEDDYEIDNEFMVPHGYLSDEEMLADGDDDPNTCGKERLKALQNEFQAERKEKTERLKPRIYGCLWTDQENRAPTETHRFLINFFHDRRMIFSDPVILLSRDPDEFTNMSPPGTDARSPIKKLRKFPDQYYPNLIRLLHGNVNSKIFLYKEFKSFLIEKETNISRKHFNDILKNIAVWTSCPDDGPMHNKFCWYVNKETRDKYECHPGIPNTWSYKLTPRRSVSLVENDTPPEVVNTPKKTADITKFTKVITEPEKKRIQLTTLSNNSENKQEKKKIPLVHLTRIDAVETNREPRPNLLTQFIQKLELVQTANVNKNKHDS